MKIALAVRIYRRMYDVIEGLRSLTALLEYGEPGKNLTTHPMEETHSYIRAAELKHVRGLKNYEVAEALGLPKPKRYDPDDSYDRQKYGRKGLDYVRRGEKILTEALDEEGFQKHVENCKAEKECWETLGREDRLVERVADLKEDFASTIRTSYREPLKEAFSRLRAGNPAFRQAAEQGVLREGPARPAHARRVAPAPLRLRGARLRHLCDGQEQESASS